MMCKLFGYLLVFEKRVGGFRKLGRQCTLSIVICQKFEKYVCGAHTLFCSEKKVL